MIFGGSLMSRIRGVQFIFVLTFLFVSGIVLTGFGSDSKAGMKAGLSFTEPDEDLAAEQSYEFVFTVINSTSSEKSKKSEWIYKIDLMMPSMDYSVDETSVSVPNPLHSSTEEGQYRIDHWESSFESASNTISWQSIAGVASATYGDIREGETQSFHFVASTDSAANNVFYWVIYGDQDSVVTGLSVLGSGTDDDNDDSGSDDDDETGDDDSPPDDDSSKDKDDDDDDESDEEDCCSE